MQNNINPKKYRFFQEISAGGVVIRKRGAHFQFLVIHRNKMNDWCLPKGHSEGEETLQETAIREVVEETGVVSKPIFYMGTHNYQVVSDTKKAAYFRLVHWFVMRYEKGRLRETNEEVKEVKWIDFESSLSFLNYENDRMFIRKASDFLNNQLDDK